MLRGIKRRRVLLRWLSSPPHWDQEILHTEAHHTLPSDWLMLIVLLYDFPGFSCFFPPPLAALHIAPVGFKSLAVPKFA